MLAPLPAVPPPATPKATVTVPEEQAELVKEEDRDVLVLGEKRKILHREVSGRSDKWSLVVISGTQMLIDFAQLKVVDTAANILDSLDDAPGDDSGEESDGQGADGGAAAADGGAADADGGAADGGAPPSAAADAVG